MGSNSTYDILIIGSGPAGLSAATTVARQDHPTLILNSGKFRNDLSKHMHALPTWDHKDPSEFRAAAVKEFDRYGCVTVVDADVKIIRKAGSGSFEATDSNGKVHLGKKLVLATGVEDVFPEIEGYSECWVSGIFHCLYCHGWEEKGCKTSGMLAVEYCGDVKVALHVARQNLRLSEKVTMYTNGDEKLASEIKAKLEKRPVSAMKVESRRISKLEKGPNRAEVIVHLEDGTTKTEGFIAHKPRFVLRGDLHKQLGLEIAPPGMLKANPPFNQSSVQGVFVAGDTITPMQTVAHAVLSGSAAGTGAALQLQANELEQEPLF